MNDDEKIEDGDRAWDRHKDDVHPPFIDGHNRLKHVSDNYWTCPDCGMGFVINDSKK